MRYLTVVLRLADNAENKLVFDQIDRINGATLSAAAWEHTLDKANAYEGALERIAAMRYPATIEEASSLAELQLKA